LDVNLGVRSLEELLIVPTDIGPVGAVYDDDITR
jgi:hypothetical protein